ncbi:MAG: hypothetical protein ACRCXC_03170 [Legionella sp.]
MNEQFTATVYCNEERIVAKNGNDFEQLYTWMLIQVNGVFGEIHGEIIDNTTRAVVRRFRKAPIE